MDRNKIIHIMVTNLCDRNCKYCCNKQYDLNKIPYVTHEELLNAETILITGGEPFAYAQPENIAKYYKTHYPNIKNVYVYTNALELYEYIKKSHSDSTLDYIDGLSISVKTLDDVRAWNVVARDNRVLNMQSNRLYIFDETIDYTMYLAAHNLKTFHRKWQEEFKPAEDSIFRKA